MSRNILSAVMIAMIGFVLFLPSFPAHAIVPAPWIIVVNDTSDAPDYVHNSVCSAGAIIDGPCTLRAAIDEANKCPAAPGACEGGVIIQLPPGTYILTIPPAGDNNNTSGDLDIDPWEDYPKYIIEGTDPDNPPVIDANGIDRVIEVHNTTVPVSLRHAVVRGGYLEVSVTDPSNKQGAGIASWIAKLTFYDVVIENNQLVCADGVSLGACSSSMGGGLYAYGELIMGLSTIRDNYAPNGGGLFAAGTAEKIIFNSTMNGNRALISGGGILNYAVMTIQNSTISDNSADYTGGINNAGTLSFYNVTVAGNGSFQDYPANLANQGTFTTRNSIIAYPVSSSTVPNCTNSGAWNNFETNVFSDSSCGTGVGILHDTDPKLTPLAWLGGSTMTRGLLEGSPAHDAVDGTCIDLTNSILTYDQRGVSRDVFCDLGAFEGVVYGIYLPAVLR